MPIAFNFTTGYFSNSLIKSFLNDLELNEILSSKYLIIVNIENSLSLKIGYGSLNFLIFDEIRGFIVIFENNTTRFKNLYLFRKSTWLFFI